MNIIVSSNLSTKNNEYEMNKNNEKKIKIWKKMKKNRKFEYEQKKKEHKI